MLRLQIITPHYCIYESVGIRPIPRVVALNIRIHLAPLWCSGRLGCISLHNWATSAKKSFSWSYSFHGYSSRLMACSLHRVVIVADCYLEIPRMVNKLNAVERAVSVFFAQMAQPQKSGPVSSRSCLFRGVVVWHDLFLEEAMQRFLHGSPVYHKILNVTFWLRHS